MTLASPGVLLAAARVSGEVVPARAQMATTLGFHIILACLGVALPSVVLLAEFIGLRRGGGAAVGAGRRRAAAVGGAVAGGGGGRHGAVVRDGAAVAGADAPVRGGAGVPVRH